jgi:perosamine synthetase
MLPLVKVAMPDRDQLMPALESVLYGGMIAEGENVYQFEAEFAQCFGLPNALAMSSGTAALHIAMLLSGVQKGDEVITTSMTAEPTNTTILQTGAIPVFADVLPTTGNLDPESVEQLITPRTKAICIVHYAGYPVELDRMRALANQYGVLLIEDCAHALGAQWHQQGIGTIGDFAIFSFQAIKHMTTIDGGILTMRNPDNLPQARRLRWFGMPKGVPRTEVDITTPGFKYNMTNVAAVIGQHQLKNIKKLLQCHIANGIYFDSHLGKIQGLTPASIPPKSEPTYWLYTLLADNADDVIKCLDAIQVSASKLHRPNHLHSIFAPYRRPLPGLETFYRKLVHLPCGWWVKPEDTERIVTALGRG